MAFLDLVTSRHSVRSYQHRPVEPEKVAAIIEAGLLSPSAVNKQPTRVFIASTPDELERVGRSCPRFVKDGSVFGAPLALVVFANQGLSYVRKYDNKNFGDIDASIVCTHMMMEATELGLGTCWVGHFHPGDLRDALGVRGRLEPVAILTVGYADEPEAVDMRQHLFGRRISPAQFLDLTPAPTKPKDARRRIQA